ncbi:MAG TPA: four-carbon acid sugar kinase family protein [Symbiobacteriaceae bacterium]|jgi:uncharacterized protein YgbK (DUF1537 family)
MRHIAIMADDLTGASDSGVQFARKGLQTMVLFDTQNLAADTDGVEAVAVDTDSRAIAPPEAYDRNREVAGRVRAAGFAHIYKKVDSTLRGNPGWEIDGVMDAMPFDLAVVAPAFPRLGRTTVAGQHYLNGVPVSQTEIARDPKCPVTESRIANLLASQSRRRTGNVELPTVRQGARAIRMAVAGLVSAGVQLAIFDVAADGDLETIAAALADTTYRILWVGSAGLADYLPAALGFGAEKREPVRLARSGKPVLLVAGSISGTTRAQVARVMAQPGVVAVELNPLLVLGTGTNRAAELSRCRTALAAALKRGADVVFTSGSAPEQVAEARAAGERLGLDGTAVADRVAAALGEAAAQVLKACPVQGVIMTGGDTAKAVCRELGVTGLQLLKELEAGVPLSRLVGGANLPAVTKAGAFGTAETLLRALRALKGEH